MTQISILTSTKFATSKSLLVLTSSWPTVELREILFFVFSSVNKHKTGASFQPVTASKRNPRGNATRPQWGFGHCSWLLYQFVVTVRGGSLLPHQWLLYFQTCQVNIWKQALALEADCCSHSCDYGHTIKNTEMLMRDEATPVEYNTVAQR